MNINEVKELIQEVLRSDISEFELEHMGTKVRLKRGNRPDSTSVSYVPEQTVPTALRSQQATPDSRISNRPEGEDGEEDATLHIITSPIVGTFYRAPNPESEPYVKVGDLVHEGTVLCIIEAMKLMNEIPSDVEGRIARIYVENGHPVEFGQKLFGIQPKGQI